MEKIYKVKMNSHGSPDFSTAKEVLTKEIKYFDEEEKVWKIGEVIVEQPEGEDEEGKHCYRLKR